MMNSNFFASSSATRADYLALLSPSTFNATTPRSKPQMWQMEAGLGLSDLPPTPCMTNPRMHCEMPAHMTSVNTISPCPSLRHEDTSAEGYLIHSDLDDNEFFRLYSEKHVEKINKNEPFPLKLYRILHEAALNGDDDIISFNPSGLSFTIHKIEEFVEKIMPKYFTSNRMTSFQRQLNLYGFRRRLRGEDKGGFFHDAFRMGQRKRSLVIKRRVQSMKVPPVSKTKSDQSVYPPEMTRILSHFHAIYFYSCSIFWPTTISLHPWLPPSHKLSSRP